MKYHHSFIILTILSIFTMNNLFAQTDLIEIDSATRAAVRTVPFDKPFLIKVPIEAESVNNIFLIKKHKNKSLDGTVAYYSSSPGGYKIPKIEKNYFWTKKTGGKNYLFISIADEYLFKPSESYFIIPDFRQTDASVINFFDAYYQSTISTGSTQAALLTKAEEHLSKFEGQMRKIYGNKIDFGFMTLDHFINNRKDFDSDTNTLRIDTLQQRYESSKSIANTGLASATARLSANFPSFDSITSMQLFTGSTINKEATSYISGNNLFKNDLISDLSYLRQTNQLNNLLSGATALTCALCEQADISSNTVKELNKRAANIDSSIKQLNMLQRSLYLLKAKATPKSNVDTGITRINLWLRELEASKDAIVIMAKQRSKIEDIIMDSVFAGRKFTYTQILSGNTYMSFETRNKMLLTPDFGIVTSAITSEGKSLEYGIIPYLGFHINLMAVDKDITFKSYKKHPLQYFSLMVGWSLVNMKKDSAYANFFEKSSLLTGIGFRLNNAFRITAGTQWLFKLGLDANHQETRKLKAMPFIGLSFDLNVKQYLNGFTDLLSGIGKTNPSTPKTNTQ